MTLTQLLRSLARTSATGRAVRKGRLPQRTANKAIGRTAGRGLGRLWR